MGVVCWGGFAPSEQPRVYSKYYPGPNYITTIENNKKHNKEMSNIEILTPPPAKAGSWATITQLLFLFFS